MPARFRLPEIPDIGTQKTTTELRPVLFRPSLRRFRALNASGIAQRGLTLQTSVARKNRIFASARNEIERGMVSQRKHVRGRRGFLNLSPRVAPFSAGHAAVRNDMNRGVARVLFWQIVKLLIDEFAGLGNFLRNLAV